MCNLFSCILHKLLTNLCLIHEGTLSLPQTDNRIFYIFFQAFNELKNILLLLCITLVYRRNSASKVIVGKQIVVYIRQRSVKYTHFRKQRYSGIFCHKFVKSLYIVALGDLWRYIIQVSQKISEHLAQIHVLLQNYDRHSTYYFRTHFGKWFGLDGGNRNILACGQEKSLLKERDGNVMDNILIWDTDLQVDHVIFQEFMQFNVYVLTDPDVAVWYSGIKAVYGLRQQGCASLPRGAYVQLSCYACLYFLQPALQLLCRFERSFCPLDIRLSSLR